MFRMYLSILFAVAAALWQSLPVVSGELTFGWSKINKDGNIYDMEFMPDNNYFVFADYKNLKLCSTETGELVHAYPFAEKANTGNIEFTPDSTKMIFAYGNKIELRNVGDMSVINNYQIPTGTDTSGLNVMSGEIAFDEMVVDPVRPYIYVVRHSSGYLSGGKYFSFDKLVIYNYETMEEAGKISTTEDEGHELLKIAISKDGKYLAANTRGPSHLKVWNLETRERIRNFQLSAEGTSSGEPSCTKFSELNTDLIYFSGRFPQSAEPASKYNGLFIYSVSANKIIDSTFGVGEKKINQGYFTFIDNEKRLIYPNYGGDLYIINLENKIIEHSYYIETGAPGAWIKSVFSHKYNTFVGFAGSFYSIGKYNPLSIIDDDNQIIQVLYPNPTDGLITLEHNCHNPKQYYELYNSNGIILTTVSNINNESGALSIDLSSYSQGIYYLKLYCGSTFTTYKIVKEG